MTEIKPLDERLVYCGRIDFEKKEGPLFVFPASFVRFKLNGKTLKIKIKNQNEYYLNHLGILVDDVYMGKLRIANEGETILDFSGFLGDGKELQEVTIYKTQDGCHQFTLESIWVDADAQVEKGTPLSNRRIEIYGDSISAGEVAEAMDLVAGPDPENHMGLPSNSYYSYSWFLARKLKATLHDIAQGGISLFDKQGWYSWPEYIGMESVYNKIAYQPKFGPTTDWDFKKYIPQLVVLAFGQNDANPNNYMAEDYEGEDAKRWRKRYREFIEELMEYYPGVHVVCTTTILNHDPGWDKAIHEVCTEIGDSHVHHFLYEKNGCGTPGHVRAPEAEKMASELAAYVETLGIDW